MSGSGISWAICKAKRGADLHMAQLIPLPLTVSCFSNIQIGFAFLVPAHPGSPGKRAVKRVCVCVDERKQVIGSELTNQQPSISNGVIETGGLFNLLI